MMRFPEGSGAEVLDHTADRAVRIRARTLDDLFVAAAHGLLRLIFADPGEAANWSGTRLEHGLELAGTGAEELLVPWLDEILYLVQTKGRLPVEFWAAVRGSSASWALAGEMTTLPLREGAPGWQGEIKATTHHGLEISRVDGGWQATVIFDL